MQMNPIAFYVTGVLRTISNNM